MQLVGWRALGCMMIQGIRLQEILHFLLTSPPAILHLNPTSSVLLRDAVIGRSFEEQGYSFNFLAARCWWSFSAADLSHLLPRRCFGCFTSSAGLLVWAAAAYESYSIRSLRCVLTALGAGRWTRLAIWLRGSLLGSEQKTHYPQWTKATERWFPLWKPLIPLLWVEGWGGRNVEKGL